jgi:hypothetical protein
MIVKTIERQANQVFRTLLGSVELCPDDDFSLNSDTQHGSVGRIAMHVGSSIESAFLTEEFRSKWNAPVASKEECVKYLASCRDDLLLPFVRTEALLEADAQPKYFVSKLDRVMKILRHIAHHTGEIGCLLRSKGLEGARFI